MIFALLQCPFYCIGAFTNSRRATRRTSIGRDNFHRFKKCKKLGMTFYKTTKYTKLDGSATFRAETWRRV